MLVSHRIHLYTLTRISGRHAPFILGLPAGFPRAHAGTHFVRFSYRASRGSFASHTAYAKAHYTHKYALLFLQQLIFIKTLKIKSQYHIFPKFHFTKIPFPNILIFQLRKSPFPKIILPKSLFYSITLLKITFPKIHFSLNPLSRKAYFP